jgi:hypothetical protein
MTPERKRTVMLMIATIIIGILIGALGVGFLNKSTRVQPRAWRKDGKEGFIQKIITVVGADSTQAEQIRPHILETISRIDSLQKQTESQVRVLVDSFEIKLKPILREKQMEELRQFHRRGRDASLK